MTITVTLAQAHRVAAQLSQLQQTLELLTLGTAAAGRSLLAIDTDTGALTFADPAEGAL